mmetsp:Transcript_20622/g.24772  ORF Transcript_20622/g.24772 Transcript_20622/m.24772 type:complete len:156 (-) Transcript_20622:647-1114(-)|eukprot:CAMPEP_0197857186 /NCGR_PEP_ID=MMETSP1438-20131217/30004_1 /TAXON_ID=1461541 /ORGANISM="Pterosperma sp., Strain CCMP1384" /LENGTH=155 /DNA_ID=CAMNT_0043472917 /DNA_START=94 /DNA_END=561 /DNA_ORIENTATION=+
MYDSSTPRYRGATGFENNALDDDYDKNSKGGDAVAEAAREVDAFITDNFTVLMFALLYVMCFIGTVLISLLLHLKVGRHQEMWSTARNVLALILVPMTAFVIEPRPSKWMAPLGMVKGCLRRAAYASQNEGGVIQEAQKWWVWRKKYATSRVDIV